MEGGGPSGPGSLPSGLGRSVRLSSTLGMDAGSCLSRQATDWLEGRCRYVRVGVPEAGVIGAAGGEGQGREGGAMPVPVGGAGGVAGPAGEGVWLPTGRAAAAFLNSLQALPPDWLQQ